jgi:hypothetical protein
MRTALLQQLGLAGAAAKQMPDRTARSAGDSQQICFYSSLLLLVAQIWAALAAPAACPDYVALLLLLLMWTA